ncbi:MAG: hypoxanthine phosphoribosyltransferase [Erysipelotrichaceae bacterium]|nr:hypoxanthine phosphoribosyltransferase [Erysipelotrichaceae bacterium]
MNKAVKKVLYSQEDIVQRCRELGEQISRDYAGYDRKVLMVGLLKGSVPFMAELMKHMTVDCEIDFMDVSSYEGAESTGEIRVLKDLSGSAHDMDIIIVEDIVDTGRTLVTVKEMLMKKGAHSVKIATLLDKPEGRVVGIVPEYIGFTIANEFVIGFGLDFNQAYRCLPYVGVLKEEYYK